MIPLPAIRWNTAFTRHYSLGCSPATHSLPLFSPTRLLTTTHLPATRFPHSCHFLGYFLHLPLLHLQRLGWIPQSGQRLAGQCRLALYRLLPVQLHTIPHSPEKPTFGPYRYTYPTPSAWRIHNYSLLERYKPAYCYRVPHWNYYTTAIYRWFYRIEPPGTTAPTPSFI